MCLASRARPQKGRGREPGTPGVGRGARHQTDAPADPVEQPELVAAALYEAETAAKGLSGQSVGNGLSGADMLQSPENRAVAARCRSGDAGRRVTAALARAMQALQEWASGPRAPARGSSDRCRLNLCRCAGLRGKLRSALHAPGWSGYALFGGGLSRSCWRLFCSLWW